MLIIPLTCRSYFINLDPAVNSVPFAVNIDIRCVASVHTFPCISVDAVISFC